MEKTEIKTYLVSTLKLFFMVVLAGIVVLAAFIAGVAFQRQRTPVAVTRAPIVFPTPPTITTEEDVPGFNVFWEAWNIVESEFYSDIPDQRERVYGAIRGMVSTYGDEHTAFIDPTRASVLQEDASGAFEGIGAAVRLDELGRLVIAEPFPGRPAAEAGLLRGDVVLEVDGQPLRGLSLYESVALIRGPAGSTVVLTILREGEPEPFKVEVVRARIEIEVVQAEMLEGNVGYVSLSEFSSGASEKLARAIRDLQKQGATSLILDLRNNPGGFLSESVAVASLFLEGGVVVREEGKDPSYKQVYEARGAHVATDIPMVVLINRGSASASEIVAGALKDHGRATIIGEQSFGKGTVQLPHTLSDGSQLRVTIAQWFTPNGNLIQGEGIIPDVVVEMTQEDALEGRDPQLDRAVSFLQGSTQ
ncbi:MAG: S41 family peptidase [Caldilineae bacterium]|nr:MAG: S41 family peptidase [Caldilineae bacterium]